MDNIFCIILAKLVMLLITSSEASSNSTTFNASIQLFDDADFLVLHNNGSGNYQIGQDTIYIEVILPDDGRISGVEINNVFICTLSQTVNETNEDVIGCVSPLIDIDGAYNIISNDNTTESGQDYEANIIENSYVNVTNSNRVRFSFLTFNIGRTTMNIHVELTLQLENGETASLSLQTHTEIDLFISSIIDIGIYDIYQNETNKKYQLSVLTQSADYIKLISPNIILTPFGGSNIASISSVTTSCLVASAYTCGQIFSVSIDAPCPPGDLSGSYDIKFDVVCLNINDSLCTTFLNDNNGDQVILSFKTNFVDNTCINHKYQIFLNKSITFYNDEHFLFKHNANEEYVVAQDTIFVQVQVHGHAVNSIKINDVFICSADDDDVDVGCLSSSVNVDDVDGIILNGATIENEKHDEINIIENPGNGLLSSTRARFSFLAFDIGATTLHIHIQLTVTFDIGVQFIASITSKTYVVTNNIMVTNTKTVSTSITQDDNNNSPTTNNVIISFFFVFVMCCMFHV